MSKYSDEIARAMLMLAEHEKTFFMGQSVAYPGNVIYKNLEPVPTTKKLELPVFEETQMGMTLGLSIAGYIPVSIFPRFNFLILGLNQLVNHIDKIEQISDGKFKPHVIIKTMVGSVKPLHPGVQHCSDFTDSIQDMLTTVEVRRLDNPDKIFAEYSNALINPGAYLMVEYGDMY